MTIAAALLDGLLRALEWPAIGFLAIGVLLGAVVGILPGLSGAVMLAMVLPFAVGLSPTGAFAVMIGIATVTATTGDLTSILLGVPGEPGAAATIVDGHPMARRGEASRAISASLFSSLAGSFFGALALAVTIPVVAPMTRSLASPELFMFAVLGIALVAPLSKGSKIKGLAAGGIGLMLSTIGLDAVGATPRFTLGQLFLWEGVGPIPLALGLFAIPEIVEMAAMNGDSAVVPSTIGGGIWSGIRDVGRLWRVVVRSSAIGTIVGFLPGVGTSVSQWVAYADAAGHSSSSHTNFGDGAIEGVIAPSAANNATLGGALAPTLALGIPGSLMSAMLLSALVVKGLVPGPRLLMPDSQGGQLTLVFSLVWFMAIGNVFAVALSLWAVKPLIRLASVRAGRLVPFLILLVFIGAYAERQAIADLFITSLLGLLGLALMRYRWPRAPVLMGLVLGPLAENRLSLSMEAFGFSWMARPGVIAIALLLIAGFAFSKRAPGTNHAGERTGTAAASSAIEPGELVFIGILFVMLLAGLVAAGAYPARAAMLPRLVALVTMTLLVAVVVPGLRPGRSRVPDGLPVRVAHLTSPAIWWIPLFLISLWSVGFIIGAPLAILGYLIVEAREHPVRSIAFGVGSYLVLEIALHRLLGVALWEGALHMWVG